MKMRHYKKYDNYPFRLSGTTGIAPFWVQTKALTETAVL